jgi:predicted enzyme related to lactoylglutathione lyase
VSERNSYSDGEFAWVNLATSDIDAAARFYGDLVGWEFEPAPGPPEETGGYGFFTYNGKQVAGGGSVQQEGQPPAWLSFIKTGDADATAQKVKDAGGAVMMEPFEILGGAGRMAVCQDAEGAFFCLFEPRGHIGAELVNEIGAWSWNNLMTRDLDQAKDFYGKVFAWEATHSDETPESVLTWQVKGQRWPEGLGGLMQMGSDMPLDAPPHWQVYFLVPDLDAAIETTTSAGGNLLFGPLEVPVARLAVLTDPQGAAFALMEPDYPEPR